MKSVLFMSLFLLVACATPGELQQKKPAFSYDIAKPVDEVNLCLEEKYRDFWESGASYKTAKGFIYEFKNGLHKPIALSVLSSTSPSSSNLLIYEHSIWFYRDELLEVIAKCK